MTLFLNIYDSNKKYCFLINYASFELNQKKLILKEFFMFKIDSSMLKLWSIPFFFSYIFHWFLIFSRKYFEKWYYFWKYTIWIKKYWFLIKYASFELLDHHHELNQKKLVLQEFFMFKIDSPMLKFWSIPLFFLYIFWFKTFVEKWHYFLKILLYKKNRFFLSNILLLSS